tara:strand:- start:359 stop:568 length:210 start_codon:yes stop_codon:yes gene_type:complete
MALTSEQAIIDLEITNAALLEAVNVTKASIEARIAAAVTVSVNSALNPLYVLTANQITTQALLINLINT